MASLRPILPALLALAASLVAFVGIGVPGGIALCAICLGGLVVARVALRIDPRQLVLVGFGLTALVWFSWLTREWSQYVASAIAHSIGGLLTGWAIAVTLRARRGVSPGILEALGAVAAVGICWELAEWVSDLTFGTGLSGGPLDTALDVAADVVGGAAGWALTRSGPIGLKVFGETR